MTTYILNNPAVLAALIATFAAVTGIFYKELNLRTRIQKDLAIYKNSEVLKSKNSEASRSTLEAIIEADLATLVRTHSEAAKKRMKKISICVGIGCVVYILLYAVFALLPIPPYTSTSGFWTRIATELGYYMYSAFLFAGLIILMEFIIILFILTLDMFFSDNRDFKIREANRGKLSD